MTLPKLVRDCRTRLRLSGSAYSQPPTFRSIPSSPSPSQSLNLTRMSSRPPRQRLPSDDLPLHCLSAHCCSARRGVLTPNSEPHSSEDSRHDKRRKMVAKLSPFDLLPVELSEQILRLVQVRELVRLRRVSKGVSACTLKPWIGLRSQPPPSAAVQQVAIIPQHVPNHPPASFTSALCGIAVIPAIGPRRHPSPRPPLRRRRTPLAHPPSTRSSPGLSRATVLEHIRRPPLDRSPDWVPSQPG